MRIAFDAEIFTQQHHGGVSRAHARLAGALAARTHQVRINAAVHVNAYLSGLSAEVAPGLALADTSLNRRLARLVNRVAEPVGIARFSPDIVQETYYRRQPVGPRRGARVLMVYDMIHELFPAQFTADDPTAALKAAAVARADHVLCISESTRTDLLRFHPAATARSSTLLLGFDPAPPGIEAPPPPDQRPYLLFVGQRGIYKNFAGLLASYAASPALRAEFDLLAVGGGTFSASETEAIARHGLSGRVHQRPADDRALAGLYAGASVFIYPSLYEGFGIPPLEAMAAGTPVVAMRASSVPEVCGTAARYAEPNDPASLTVAIEAVALSPATAAALVQAGRARLQAFSWERTAQVAERAYQALL